MRAAATLVAVLLAVALPAQAQTEPAEEPVAIEAVDTSEFPATSLFVSAPPALAGIDLPAEAFRVTEDGRPVAVEVRKIAGDELEVVLLIDTSGSMQGGPLISAKFAALGFVQQLPPTTPVAVVGFGDEPAVASGFTADTDEVVTAIEGLEAEGGTALYDAVAQALDQFGPEEGIRRTVVLLSDGGDTVSTTELATATDRVEASGVDLIAVELQSPDNDHSALLALSTTGEVVAVEDPTALSEVYGSIAADLVNRYQLTWTSGASGGTTLAVAIDHAGVTAAGTQVVLLPRVSPAPPPAPTPAGGPGPTPAPRSGFFPTLGFLQQPPAFVIGVSLVFGAFVVLLGYALLREPQVDIARRVGHKVPERGTMVEGVALRATRLAERLMQRSGSPGKLYSWLENAGIMLRPGEFVVLTGSIGITGLALGTLIRGPLLGVALAAVGVGVMVARVPLLAERRRSDFADQLEDTLLLLSGTLRAGYGLMQAVDTVANEAPTPTGEEFRRLVAEARLGRELDEAMDAMVDRLGNQDFEWVVQAIKIQREVGGDLAQILDTVAGTIRERNRIRRQIKALSAEGRMSAAVLIPLPIGVGFAIYLINPEYMQELFTTTAGQIMLAVGAVLLVIGAIWIRRVVRLVF